MRNDDAVKSANFRPMNVLTVVKVKRDPESGIDVATAANNVVSQVPQISLALRTAFLNPKFVSTVLVCLR